MSAKLAESSAQNAFENRFALSKESKEPILPWLGMAITAALCIVTFGTGSLSFDICFDIGETIIAVCLIAQLLTGEFKSNSTAFDLLACAWLFSELIGAIWGYHTGYYHRSTYQSRMDEGGTYGPLTHLGDIASSIGLYLCVSRMKFASSSRAILPIIACSIGVITLASVEEVRNVAFGTVDPRIQATFTNPNLLAAFVCLALPVSLSWTFERSLTIAARVPRAVLVLALTAILALTQSRGGLLGCTVGVLYVIAATLSQHLSAKINRVVSVFVIVSASTILLGFLAFPHILHQGRGASDTERISAWSGALTIIHEHPVLGLGDASYPAALGDLHLHDSLPGSQSGLIGTPVMHLHAHDLLLQSWVERGILGAIVTLGLILVIGNRALELLHFKTLSPTSCIQIGATASLIATLCQNVADYTLWFAPISLIFWFTLALANRESS